MEKYDVVYILKQEVEPGEIVFSLRSIEKNLPHGKVWFYCGKPEGIEPDRYVQHKQIGGSKWERTKSSLKAICKNDEITEKFWLFNDDFYVLKPVTSEEPMYRGLILDHVRDVERRHNGATSYTRQLRICDSYLRDAGQTRLDYTLHAPMLIERVKMIDTLDMFPSCPMFRSLYGNFAKIGGTFHRDVKTINPDKEIPADADYFSTSDKSFKGYVKQQLEERFPEPCKYEVAK